MNKPSPLVSIVMPAYNAQKYIKEAIRSVLNQSYTAWELVVINDGSTDATASIVAAFNDPRIRRIDQENRGVSAARNAGLDAANGKYITFLDADDFLPPESLKARADYFETHPEADILDGRAIVKDEHLKQDLRLHEPSYTGRLFPRLIRLDSGVFLTCYYMFRAAILGPTRFREDMTHAEDLFFFLELSSRGDIRYGSVPETVFWYRVGHASAMGNLDGYENGYFKLLEKAKELEGITLYERVYLHLKVARILLLTWLRRGEPVRAFKSVLRSLRPAGGK
jgi:teichuronic acid biosynthesis glycosyltransferase TuaG